MHHTCRIQPSSDTKIEVVRNQNQIWWVNTGTYMFFGSIEGSDYYAPPLIAARAASCGRRRNHQFFFASFFCPLKFQKRTPRIDHDLDHRFSLSWSRSFKEDIFPMFYDLAHVPGWDPYILRISSACYLGWVCTVPTLHNLSQRQVRN